MKSKEDVEINLVDLPKNKYFIGLNKEFNDKLIGQFKEKFYPLMENCNRVIGIRDTTLYSLYKRKQYQLSILMKISDSLKINLLDVQKEITYVKLGGHCKIISPQFPIKLSKELARILAHLFGDGVLCMDKKGLLKSAYYNQEKVLREELKEDISKIFKISDFYESIHKTTNFVSIPSTVSRIIYLIVTNFNSKSCRVPEFIKEAHIEIKKEFIRAFLDDEAHVCFRPPHRYIEVTLSNEKLLEDLKELLLGSKINSTKIYHRKIRGFDAYYFFIKHEHNLREYYNKIGFIHPKKISNLQKILHNPGRKHYASGETEKRILDSLSCGLITSTQLSRELNRKIVTVNHFLKKLEQKERIKRVCLKKEGIIWRINHG